MSKEIGTGTFAAAVPNRPATTAANAPPKSSRLFIVGVIMQKKVIAHARKSQREGFAKSMCAAGYEGKRIGLHRGIIRRHLLNFRCQKEFCKLGK